MKQKIAKHLNKIVENKQYQLKLNILNDSDTSRT